MLLTASVSSHYRVSIPKSLGQRGKLLFRGRLSVPSGNGRFIYDTKSAVSLSSGVGCLTIVRQENLSPTYP